ncbi:hypothetical protein BLNAU_12641 [Blattamonas nauphoetae]|uniref:PRA1 family protein n=1 Tax=Blattamonas nauphoetae TaxID=2049346 RepID=A0ABQ9XLM4_9EUKA|nr:hypothetical protein BLNAU_12641 [Blattamonas nauphoetae]
MFRPTPRRFLYDGFFKGGNGFGIPKEFVPRIQGNLLYFAGNYFILYLFNIVLLTTIQTNLFPYLLLLFAVIGLWRKPPLFNKLSPFAFVGTLFLMLLKSPKMFITFNLIAILEISLHSVFRTKRTETQLTSSEFLKRMSHMGWWHEIIDDFART